MSNFINRFVTKLILFIGWRSSKLSYTKRTAFGRKIGNFLYMISAKRRSITLDNLQKAFPEKDLSWCKQISKVSFQNIGIVFTELATFKYFTEDDFRYYFQIENLDEVIEAHKRGKGVLLLSAHYGNWEILAYAFGLVSKIPITIPVKPQRNKSLDDIINLYRTSGGNKVVSMYNAALEIVKALRKGGIVAMLVDQSATEDRDVFIEYFGRPASTFESPAALCLKFDIPLFMAFAERQENGSYYIKAIEIDHSDLENSKEGIYELTKRHVNLLEKMVRKHPDHWAWQHRRWKHTPKQQ